MGSQADLSRFWDYGEHFANQNRWVFECAWEVANKVGGIYTVIRSKTGVSISELGDQYVLLGPYFEMKARAEVEEEDFPFHHPLGQAVDRQVKDIWNLTRLSKISQIRRNWHYLGNSP